MADIVDLAADTTDYYAPATAHSVEPDAAPRPDLRTKQGRAAAGLPPRTRTPRGPAKVASRRKPSPKPTDYTAGVKSIFDLAAFGLQFTSPVDAATVSVYGPHIAVAVNDLAQQKPELAKALDKMLAVGPYGALLAVVAPMVGQILANHRVVPTGMLGSVPADDIIAMAVKQAEQH